MIRPHQPFTRVSLALALGSLSLLTTLAPRAMAQAPSQAAAPAGPSALNYEAGTTEISTPDFAMKLVKSSQTIAALEPKGQNGFDFTPSDWLQRRAANRFHHLGDLTLRVRKGKAEAWRSYDTAAARQTVTPLLTSGNVLAAADLSPTLPTDSPVRVVRTWAQADGHLALRFTITNKASQPVDIGALGIPMVFNNIISERNLEQAHAKCSFFDPYIGQDAGYLQVTRLSGEGPALVVVPEKGTPFEAYAPLDEPMAPNQTFEGTFAWMVHSQAYAENEWRNAQPWNPPTIATLAPGESRTYGVRFLLSDSIRHIDDTLAANRRPVTVSVPGPILPMDLDGRLFLKYGSRVKAMTVYPAGALKVQADAPTKSGWQAYTVRSKNWGRARLTIAYEDGTKQSVSYYVTKPAAKAVSDLGNFSMTKQWFVDPNDPFGRSPSVFTYDREANKQVTQDSRAWISGLGDEGGSGSWLAAAMKEFGQPNKAEIAKYEQFIDKVLWGKIQFKDGPNKYGVRKSVFYYSPSDVPGFLYDPNLDWRSWTSWNKEHSEDVGRGYNYPHVVAAYWSMYRIARNNPGLVTNHPWDWYLNQAYETIKFTFSRNPDGNRRVGWVELGLMEGTVFLDVLKDLQHEKWTAKANDVERMMKERADRWKTEAYPFGSEMAWDSTGQEEVYAWCKYFGLEDKAQVSLDSILGYMPTLPHWGYNGNARRYWDFLYGGKLSRIERQLHHYGSGLNAIPVLSEYRDHPDDFYLLRVGYGGMMGALSSIDQEGFASVAFHSFPSTLKWDAYTGDYGPNFFGHAQNAATYLVNHPQLGWLSFGGNVAVKGEDITLTPLDAFRQRVYIAPLGLWLTLDAGTFQSVQYNTNTGKVRVQLTQPNWYTNSPTLREAVLRIEQPAKVGSMEYSVSAPAFKKQRDAFLIPLQKTPTWVELSGTARKAK